MKSSDKNLKRRLIQKRKNVKSKLEVLKQGELAQEQMFLPITKQLQNIQNEIKVKSSTTTPSNLTETKSMKMEEYNDDDNNVAANDYSAAAVSDNDINDDDKRNGLKDEVFYAETPKKRKLESLNRLHSTLYQYDGNDGDDNDNNVASNPDVSTEKQSILDSIIENDDSIDQDKSRFEQLARESLTDYLDQYDPLPRRYISALHQDISNEFDHRYGIRLDPETEKFYIGDSQMHIDGSDVIVQNKRFKGTQGLYELLFKKDPKLFTQEDEKNYKQIILKTNAHRRNYQSNRQIVGSKSKKYTQIVAPLVSGKGVYLQANQNKIDYVHWDDANELVDRLRLLLASQQAGHTGHINEITSIIEELKEAQIII